MGSVGVVTVSPENWSVLGVHDCEVGESLEDLLRKSNVDKAGSVQPLVGG